MRKARSCYGHLAGELGVLVYDGLLRQGALRVADSDLELTAAGYALFARLGIAAADLAGGRGAACRVCLDWSERRHHLGGAAGKALLQRMLDLGWAERPAGSRVVRFSAAGERALRECFALPE